MRSKLYKIGDRRFDTEARTCSRNKGCVPRKSDLRKSYEVAARPGVKLYQVSRGDLASPSRSFHLMWVAELCVVLGFEGIAHGHRMRHAVIMAYELDLLTVLFLTHPFGTFTKPML